MRPKKPTHTSIEQVRITRDGPTAVIEYADPTYGDVNLTIGKHLTEMSDQQIVDVLNQIIAAQAQSLQDWDNTITEIPVGKSQIKFNCNTGQWVPRGEVLRCVIGDNEHHEAVIEIDDKQLSLAEFGRLLTVYAGWGMRIAFVPEELVHQQPDVKVRQPKRRR